MDIQIIKRDGTMVPYIKEKIMSAISRANMEVDEPDRLLNKEIKNIEDFIFLHASRRFKNGDPMHVEEIQDMVQSRIIHLDKAKLAETYTTYRYKRALIRKSNSTDESILSLIDLTNEEVMRENSNKAAHIASTQRDLMAGETSKDVTFRMLLPNDVSEAHKEGILHFHDSDYFIQKIHNCCLINLEDMLQNGTVINGTMIEKPHSFATACNIATQIMAVVASGQYGGQSVSLAHLAPFVDVSRQKIRKTVIEEVGYTLGSVSEMVPSERVSDIINKIVEDRLREEVKKGVQTIQYQINTLNTSNG